MKLKMLVAGAAMALGVAALGSSASAAANLLSNGGFENSGFGGTTSYYNIGPVADHPVPADFGWTVSQNNVDIISYVSYGPAAPGGGSYGLDLVGYGATGEISQTFNTVLGRTYNVSFDYTNNPGFTDPTARVLVNGSQIGSTVTGIGNGYDWQVFNGSFTGTGAPTTFALQEVLGGNNGGVFLDNVSVTAAVPEPATWAVMLVGFGGLGAAMRAKRRKQALAAA